MRWFIAEMEHDTEKRPEIPNEETIAAMKEADDMVKHPERYETFHSMAELLKSVLED